MSVDGRCAEDNKGNQTEQHGGDNESVYRVAALHAGEGEGGDGADGA